MKKRVIFALCLLLAACVPTAADRAVSDATAQYDQYRRDAAATETQRAIALESNIRNLEATDTAAARVAGASQTAAFHIEQTATQAAIAGATGTARAEVGLTETAVAQATGTAVANRQATETAAVEATRVQIALSVEEARANREQAVAVAGWIAGFVFIVLAIVLVGLAGFVAIGVFRKRQSLFTHGPFNAPLFILDAPNGRQIVIDPLRLFNPAVVIDQAGLSAPELAAPAYQERTTARAQAVALQQASHNPHAPIVGVEKIASRRIGPAEWRDETRPIGETARTATPLIGEAGKMQPPTVALPANAPWQVMNDWHGGGLPLGMGEGGMLLANPETSPHLLMAGTSGSGKTRYGLRPLIAAALADGWHVAIFDRSGLDFLPFRNHPNAALILLPDPAEAIGYMLSLYSEIERRFGILRDRKVSTWGQLPGEHGPRVLAVFDEFSNLADGLSGGDREELWRGARMVAAEGRKAGVHLALALQDPTHKSIDLRIRRNCTPLSFRVKDGEASRVILGASGAESLPPRHFLTVLGDLIRGVAFSPDDGEITSFLTSRPVKPLPSLGWLQSEHVEESSNAQTDDMGEQIRAMKAAGASLNTIQRELFGYVGGKAYEAVKGALKQGDTTDITTPILAG
jgi:hypothetical protein